MMVFLKGKSSITYAPSASQELAGLNMLGDGIEPQFSVMQIAMDGIYSPIPCQSASFWKHRKLFYALGSGAYLGNEGKHEEDISQGSNAKTSYHSNPPRQRLHQDATSRLNREATSREISFFV